MNNEDANYRDCVSDNQSYEICDPEKSSMVQSQKKFSSNSSTGGKYQANRSAKHRKTDYAHKWYLSIPIILLAIFMYPVSIVLTILRAKHIKKQESSYRRNTIIIVGVHIIMFVMIIISAVSSTKWDNSFENAISTGNYATAYEMLREEFGANIDVVGINYYFRIFEVSGEYEMAIEVLEQYYSNLTDKTQFDSNIRKRYQELEGYLSPEEFAYVQSIFMQVDEAIQLKEKERYATLEKQNQKEEADRVKAEEQEQLRAEEQAKKKLEKEKAALDKAKEERAAKVAKIKEAVDNYFEKDSLRNLKKVSKQDRELVEDYLIELAVEYLVYNPTSAYDARKLHESIEKLHNLYLDAFPEGASSFSTVLNLTQGIISEYENLEKIESRYPFSITKASSCVWKEYYITQRLEKAYSENILGAIQKEIDSYSYNNTSDWVAYNVEYLPFVGATRGDDVTIIHSSELNPFPEAGAYKLLCYSDGKTTSLTDNNGFVFDAPVVYVIPDDNQLNLDIEDYKITQNNIHALKLELSDWSLAAEAAQLTSDNSNDT